MASIFVSNTALVLLSVITVLMTFVVVTTVLQQYFRIPVLSVRIREAFRIDTTIIQGVSQSSSTQFLTEATKDQVITWTSTSPMRIPLFGVASPVAGDKGILAQVSPKIENLTCGSTYPALPLASQCASSVFAIASLCVERTWVLYASSQITYLLTYFLDELVMKSTFFSLTFWNVILTVMEASWRRQRYKNLPE